MNEDIVRVFQTWCNAQTPPIMYDYGDIYALNLFLNKAESEKEDPEEKPVYFLQEQVVRNGIISSSGLVYEGEVYDGAFSILKESSLDTAYFAERSETRSDEESRYTNNIEPLLPYAKSLAKFLLCNEYDIQFWSVVDNINFLDENRDGILCRFKIAKRD